MTELSQKIDHEHLEYSKTNKQLEESSQELKVHTGALHSTESDGTSQFIQYFWNES